MRLIIKSFILLLLLAAPVMAFEVRPGDSVMLINRNIGIPAHPQAGDSRVSLRFTSEEIVKVLRIDQATRWVQVQAEDQRIGWITKRYIASIQSREKDGGNSSVMLSWCPAKRSSQPHTSGRLRVATWNMANLHAQNGQSVYTGKDPSEMRDALDYERIRCYVRLFDPDILAVQEVDGKEALQRVVDMDIYDIHVSSRSKPSGMNGKQNTGFAYKKGLSVQALDDFKALDIGATGHLRYGTQIRLKHNNKSIKLMSVHLKSGCFEDSSSGSACNRLLGQIPVLEYWIDDAAQGSEPFIVLGDFNRRFNIAGDDFWEEIDDSNPPNADLTTVTLNKPISCRDNRYDEFIDHMVFDKRAWLWVEDSSFRHVTYRAQDKAVWDQISDHCPVVVDLWIK